MEENTPQTIDTTQQTQQNPNNSSHKTVSVRGMYEDWFLDYASYVILDRAVPHINDGLKPVQRRILHSMKELDDGRYNKVANIVGNTMKYHPHGDASIGDALVALGQKELLIDTQGNWGNILTGDRAAAPRYIEARLSKFALDVVFNPKTTNWTPSYDGRKMEPLTLPIKFPLLLCQGAKGIAVGLYCEILPHNFVELIEASIKILKGEDFEIYPDFLTGGLIDVSKYNKGERGGKVRVRAKIEVRDKRTLVITQIPYSTTTDSLIDSIIAASEKNKIKIKKIDDNTSSHVEIQITLPADTSTDQTIDALYAFTDCEVSVSPYTCVIEENHPRFMPVDELLKISTQNTVNLLKQELEIALAELQEKWQWTSLERIFIENEIYEKIKPCKTDEEIDSTIFEGLKPFVKNLLREPNIEDIHKLRKIPIDRISKYNSDKANDIILAIEDDIKAVKDDIAHLTEYAISYFERILQKYGKGRERKTEIRSFDNIEAQAVAVASEKLYCNYQEGFAGYKMRGDTYVCDCSDIDDIIAFRSNGTVIIKKVQEKDFFGTDIIHIDVFRRNDERTIYNMVYQDGAFGNAYVKRFAVSNVIRDKEYDLTKGTKGTKVLYLTSNPNGEAESITVYLKAKKNLRKTVFDFDFSTLAIKGKLSQGNIISRNLIRRITLKGEGISTLSARKIWFDTDIKRLNADQRGEYLGSFSGADKILVLSMEGYYRLSTFDLSLHFEESGIRLLKFNPSHPITVIYIDEETQNYYIKRFMIDNDLEKVTNDKRFYFLDSKQIENGTQILYIFTEVYPMLSISLQNIKSGEDLEDEQINVSESIELSSPKAKGKRMNASTKNKVTKITPLEPLPYEEIEPADEMSEEEDDDILDITLNNNSNENNNPENIIQGSLF